MKVLMAPVNIAGQPIALVKELRSQGVDVSLFQYSLGQSHRFGYESGKLFDLSGKNRRIAEIEAIKESLDQNFDIYHFWMTTFFSSPKYKSFYGLDLPFLKARGKKIIYRTTGYDIRTKGEDLKVNPYSPFRYGFNLNIDEKSQAKYLAYLKDYVDVFICQDPEMGQFIPDSKIIPRSIDLCAWPFIGVERRTIPKIVHAPSKMAVKGTPFIQKAIDELSEEGLKFEFKLVHGLKQEEAIKIYKDADICIDQILIGWYGVFSIESMALGKPVIAYIRKDLADSIQEDIPIVNANPDNIKKKLKELILDFDKRNELGKKGRNYVKKIHDVRKVAEKTKSVYEFLISQPCRYPQHSYDLDYLTIHFNELYTKNKTLINKATLLERAINRLNTKIISSHTANRSIYIQYWILIEIEKLIQSLRYRGIPEGLKHILLKIFSRISGSNS